MKLRVEIGSLATPKVSGVGHYTRLLSEALNRQTDITVAGFYFNFLNRQVTPAITLTKLEKNSLIPQRVYAKLQSHNLAPPFDLLLPAVDLTIFPNFSAWPSRRTKLRAAVIHDLTYIHYPELVEVGNLAHLRRVVPRTIKQADFIITVSRAVKAELVTEFGLDPGKCIATPIPPDPIYLQPNVNEIHNKYHIPTKDFIFFIGTLEPRKNLPTLIAAYRALPDEIKKRYSLVLAGGKGWKTEHSQQAIEGAVKAGEQIIYVGYINQADAPAFHQKASLFVMPSHYEGFGMPVVEAAASGTPIIASNIPVLREAAGDGALYADPDDPLAFRDAMQKVLQSPELQADLRKKAAKHMEQFSWDTNAKNIINYAQTRLKELS